MNVDGKAGANFVPVYSRVVPIVLINALVGVTGGSG